VQWKPGDYGTALSAALLGRNTPDVFESQFSIQLATSKQAVPLDDILASVKSDFNEIDIATNSYKGKTYGVRMISDPQLLYYRKSLFQNAGIQVPTTIEELINATAALSREMSRALPGKGQGVGALGLVSIHAAGAAQLNADNNRARLHG